MFDALLRDHLHNGPPELRRTYARLAMREVSVKDKEMRILGPKAALARPAAQGLDTESSLFFEGCAPREVKMSTLSCAFHFEKEQ